MRLDADGMLTVTDDGRGIPVDPHPKHPGKSALEVIMTVLHSGGKFSGKAYETSGGLHGVGVSVVNALSERVEVTAWKDGFEWRQAFTRGKPLGGIEKLGPTRKHGTSIAFQPDPVIFGEGVAFKPARLYRMARSKAYLFGGVEIRWSCDPSRIHDQTPAEAVFRFPNGLADFLAERVKGIETVTPEPFAGKYSRPGETGKVEWAVTWTPAGFGEADGFMQSYCNTVPTPEGGTHEAGFRAALTRSLKTYAELTGEKRGAILTAEDVVAQAGALVSVFVANPEFQGQTKERLSSSDAQRLVEKALADPFDHWLTAQPKAASALLEFVIERAEERLKRRKDKEVAAPRRPASCACPASSPTVPATPSTALRSSWSRGTRPAARPSRRATARARRSCPCAARSSTSPRPRSTSWAPTRNSPTCCWRWASRPGRSSRKRTCATTAW